MSEYDPLIRRKQGSGSDDLERVQARFDEASRAYLSSPVPWIVWAMVLPGAALATPRAFAAQGGFGVLVLWSISILIGGSVEATVIFRRRGLGSTPLGAWAMRVQGNQSMVALALSLLLIWADLQAALPGLWLLLIGHSFFLMGGLGFRPMRHAGIIYQLGGLVALWPTSPYFTVFAVATAAGNLTIAIGLMRRSAGR